jgi:hypothetical protein
MFNMVDEDFLKSNLKDPSMADPFIKLGHKRRKISNIILCSFGLLAAAAFGFASVQKSSSSKTYQELTLVENQIDECILEAQRQNTEAVVAAKEAASRSKNLNDQLTDCQNKIR